jgi:hypothetical protein
MNKFFSRYGTFLVIPPVLAVIVIVAVTFNVSTRREVTLVQVTPTQIEAYIPSDVTTADDSVKFVSPEFGTVCYEVIARTNEPSAVRATCRGCLPTADTRISAYIIADSIPIYRLILKQLR